MKFLHTADLHIGSKFAGSPQIAQKRQQEILDVFMNIVDTAREERVDMLFIAGDLFDSDMVYPETVDKIIYALGRLSCRVFISPGNHDYYCVSSPYCTSKWPDNVHIFGSEKIECVRVEGCNTNVYGAAFLNKNIDHSLLEGFTADTDGINVMVMHGSTLPPEGYNYLSTEEIKNSNLCYLALGHIHEYEGVKKAGKTTYAWTGCPEGKNFGECGRKIVLLGETDGEAVSLREICVARREYAEITADCAEDVFSTLKKDNIYKIVVTGEVDGGFDIQKYEEEAAKYCFDVKAVDRTTPARNVWDRENEENLLGGFLRNMREIEDEELKNLVLKFGLAAIEGREAPKI